MSWSGSRGGAGEEPYVPKEGRPPAPLERLIGDVARRKGWGKRLEGARIHQLWTQIAGEQLAAHAQPVRLHGGVLILRAESAAWATQVRYLTGDLVQRANEVLGQGQVTTVQVITGPEPRERDGPRR